MKSLKKLFCILLAFITVFFCTIPAFAGSSKKNNYPFIFVHGMGGWGSYDSDYKTAPYWGSAQGVKKGETKNDAVAYLKKSGYKAYAASVGPLSSAWDRACELYAQLTGTKTDYGKAHSKAHGHSRYGKSYKSKPLMGKAWNKKSPLNLVGHSFGGETIRLFASLMAYGNSDEKKATGKNTSPLFKGGYDKCIHSITTIASPHNGTQAVNSVLDIKNPVKALSAMMDLMGIVSQSGKSPSLSSLGLSQFGFSSKDITKNISATKKFIQSKDNCMYDLSLSGAKKLNEKIKLVKNTYYYSMSFYVTKDNGKGKQVPKKCPDSLMTTSKAICDTQGKTISGVKITKSWAMNDGLVPVASAKYPLTDKKTATSYESANKKGKVSKGRWYYMKPVYGTNHLSCCTSENLPGSFKSFYSQIAKMATKR
ncbi:MAG: esterase/lipase family protein [Acutalibacteraceae bacterium]